MQVDSEIKTGGFQNPFRIMPEQMCVFVTNTDRKHK